MKGKKKNQILDPIPVRNSTYRNPVVDAVVIHTPDFSLNLKLQNLLNFFIEALRSFNSTDILSGEMPRELETCIHHLKTVQSEGNLENEDIQKLLNEFIEEINKFINMFTTFCKTDSDENIDPVEIVLSTKLSRLQWLAVCLLEELKQVFIRK